MKLVPLLERAKDVDFVVKTAIERDPKKRRVKPVEQACILDFDEESSDDSDFRIEDHPDVSDDDVDSLDSGGGNNANDSSEESESDDSELEKLDELRNLNVPDTNGFSSHANVIQQATLQSKLSTTKSWSSGEVQVKLLHRECSNTKELLPINAKDGEISICCGCLGDHSDGVNEIVECDSCGVTVHEACYGISESTSLASTNSLSPTAPWFCEACKAGVKDPVCELCPNTGGIYKETDVGKWVHLICALYVPGVAFGEVDKLTSVTLFEMPYSKWGAKTCSLCTEERYSRTGVCIGCDAGMCRTYFHVTCAQREGFLSEAHSEEVDQADPFYAHCKLHSDKTLVKKRKKNYLALQLRTQCRKVQFEKEGHMESPEQVRIQRKLEKQKVHYFEYKKGKASPWVPTQKMPRLITTSASACRKLLRKAEQMGIDTSGLEVHEAQIAALVDIRKKWHIAPAFTVEFIAYYLDRNDRVKGMKTTLESLMNDNKTLLGEQQKLRAEYDQILSQSSKLATKSMELKGSIQKYHSAILSACPSKQMPNIDNIGKPPVQRPIQQLSVPTAAALKMGVGFPLKNIPSGRGDRVLSSYAKPTEPLQLNECGICRQRRDQHLLAKCDTCHLYYHTNCLNPPLSRLPKKSKLYGWQCSECDKSSESEIEEVKTPRRSRSIYSRDHRYDVESPIVTPILKIKPLDTIDDCDSTWTSPPQKSRRLSSVSDKVQLDGEEQRARKERKRSSVSDSNREGTSEYDATLDLIADLGGNNDIEFVIDNGHPEGHEGHRSSKKRRREKHRNRYSPELGMSSKEHKRKRKKKSLDVDDNTPHPRITIKIKSIPLPAGEVASESNPQRFYVPREDDDIAPSTVLSKINEPAAESRRISTDLKNLERIRSPRTSFSEVNSAKDPLAMIDPLEIHSSQARTSRGGAGARTSIPKPTSVITIGGGNCDVCQLEGTNSNTVKCDECLKLYHFSCLDPPLKTSPKKRGYSWHCADCDPTSSE